MKVNGLVRYVLYVKILNIAFYELIRSGVEIVLLHEISVPYAVSSLYAGYIDLQEGVFHKFHITYCSTAMHSGELPGHLRKNKMRYGEAHLRSLRAYYIITCPGIHD